MTSYCPVRMSVTASSEVPNGLKLTLHPVSCLERMHPVDGRVVAAILDVAGPSEDGQLAFTGADLGLDRLRRLCRTRSAAGSAGRQREGCRRNHPDYEGGLSSLVP